MKKILIMDDDESVVFALKRLLEVEGFGVADSGVFLFSRLVEILDIIKKFNPEIILLDHALGELNGLKIINAVQKNAPAAIIFSIGSMIAGSSIEEDYRKYGVVHFPGKDIKKILNCINKVCLCFHF